MKLHLIVTAVWALIVVWLVLRFDWVTVKPNEIGDFLAGTAAPPAFYWLIVGYFMQRDELHLQRKELEEARAQFTRQAAALEDSGRIQKQALSLSERERTYSELRGEIGTATVRMTPILEFFLSTNELRSPNHDKAISFLSTGHRRTNQLQLIDEISSAITGWPEGTHGSLRECLEFTKPGEFHNVKYKIYDLAKWFRRTNEKAMSADASFFYKECEGLKVTKLLAALNEMMNPLEDWGIYLGSDR